MKMIKYVIVGEFQPVVFNAPMSHKDLRALGTITSAGYFLMPGDSMNPGPGVMLAGEAMSINVLQKPTDAEFLNRFFGLDTQSRADEVPSFDRAECDGVCEVFNKLADEMKL